MNAIAGMGKTPKTVSVMRENDSHQAYTHIIY
eukprot:SAG11_NODE_2919_length_2837_cov_2.990504_2_plen_32_part_00